MCLTDVLHVSTLLTNLISVSAFRKNGAYWRTDTLTFHKTCGHEEIGQTKEIGKLFVLDEVLLSALMLAAIPHSPKAISMDQAHLRFDHMSKDSIRRLVPLVKGLSVHGTLTPCQACMLANITKTISQTPATRTMQICDLFHSDLVGSVNIMGLGSVSYWFTMTDDYSRSS